MKRFIWLPMLSIFFLLFIGVGGGLLVHLTVSLPPSRVLASSLASNALTLSPSAVPSFDTRACVKNPSSQSCNGILPFLPHNVLERANGAGACYDQFQLQLMEAAEIKDAHNTIIGSMQLLYFPKCQSYSAHLIYAGNNQTGLQMQAEVDQFNSNPVSQALNSFATWSGFDAEDELTPDVVQSTGVVADTDVWTPLLYSPTAPVQATAMVGHGNLSTDIHSQVLFTHYYASGKPTTVNGHVA